MTKQEIDRELLELAAKAAGWNEFEGHAAQMVEGGWNPLTDDGDCARMEAALGIDMEWWEVGVVSKKVYGLIERMDVIARETFSDHNGDKQAARRRASLFVAAEIGRAMP